MTLPLSPNTTYTDDNLPAIAAKDLNDLQNFLSGLYSNLYTIKGLQADGTGGNNATSLAGQIIAPQLIGQQVTLGLSPTILARLQNGNPRAWFERNGFPGGHYTYWWEDWGPIDTNGAFTSTLNPIDTAGARHTRWGMVFGNAAGSNSLACSSPTSTYPGRFWTMTPGTNANDFAWLFAGSIGMMVPATFIDSVLEFDVQLSAVGANNVTFQFGWVANAAGNPPFGGTISGAYLEKLSTDTNWQCVTCNGTTKTRTDAGVAPSAGAWQRIKIEFHGSASQFGATTVVFFINESQVLSTPTTPPSISNTHVPSFAGVRTNANTTTALIGQVKWAHNLFTDPLTPL